MKLSGKTKKNDKVYQKSEKLQKNIMVCNTSVAYHSQMVYLSQYTCLNIPAYLSQIQAFQQYLLLILRPRKSLPLRVNSQTSPLGTKVLFG